MKLTRILIITNILSLAAVGYFAWKSCGKCNTGAVSAESSEIDSTKMWAADSATIRLSKRIHYEVISGYRPERGWEFEPHKSARILSDSVFLEKGEPLVFLVWEAWEDLTDKQDGNPEFFGISGVDDPKAKHPPLELTYDGKIGVYWFETDTVDMQGKSIKRLRYFPKVRYIYNDTILPWQDTVEVFLVEKGIRP